MDVDVMEDPRSVKSNATSASLHSDPGNPSQYLDVVRGLTPTKLGSGTETQRYN